jgi:hypothetical protein
MVVALSSHLSVTVTLLATGFTWPFAGGIYGLVKRWGPPLSAIALG